MRHVSHAPRPILHPFHFHCRQFRQRLADSLRLFRIRLPFLRQLKWLIGLRRRDNCHRHISQLRRQLRRGAVEAHIVVRILISGLLVKYCALLSPTHHQRLIVALIRPPAAPRIRNRLDNFISSGCRIQRAQQRLSQRVCRPLSAPCLIKRARLVLRLSLTRDKLCHQEKLLPPAVRRPKRSIRTTLFARPRRTAAFREFLCCQHFPCPAAEIRLPGLPRRRGRKIQSIPLQPPRLVHKPPQMASVRRKKRQRS